MRCYDADIRCTMVGWYDVRDVVLGVYVLARFSCRSPLSKTSLNSSRAYNDYIVLNFFFENETRTIL